MASKLIFAFLGLLCLIYEYKAAPKPATVRPKTIDKFQSFFAKRNDSNADFKSKIDGDVKDLFNRVLKELEVKSKNINSESESLKDFLGKYEEDKNATIVKIQKLAKFFEKYDTNNSSLSSEIDFIKKTLEENDVTGFAARIKKNMNDFLAKFVTDTKDFLETINDEDRNSDPTVIKLEKGLQEKLKKVNKLLIG